MKKIEAIRSYFNTCPLLDDEARLSIDYRGSEAIEYSIYSNPVNPIVKKYVDGGALKQYSFVFSTLSYYSPELSQQLENSGFFEEFERWIENNNRTGKLPNVSGAIKVEILTSGYLMNAEADTASYQIQLRLLYREDY